jgi:tryptophan synthase alpha chain
MKTIANYIWSVNNQNRKVLSIFLTAGFPDRNHFTDLALKTFDAGADIIELGIPFSDPIADGPVIQRSSQQALENGINMNSVFKYAEFIKKNSGKPIILMGYANPILHYGINQFIRDTASSGIDGLIVPDIPLDEYDDFWSQKPAHLELILLTTPTSPDRRIRAIDSKSEGFVYCVSVTGTTGVRQKFSGETVRILEQTYQLVKKNKMLIGFGISGPQDIKNFRPYCDGVIVGSAVIHTLLTEPKSDYRRTTAFIGQLAAACRAE